MRRAALLVAYDGAPFHGFAANDGVPTVMGALSGAMATVLRVPVAELDLAGAGRTDAGVHAWGQVVSASVADATDLGDLAHRLTRMLGPAIAVRSASWVAGDFHARFSATARHYRYHVWNADHPHPLLVGRAWHVPVPLERWALGAACDPLIGEHDFSSFCRRVKARPRKRISVSAFERATSGAEGSASDEAHEARGGSEADDEPVTSMVRRVFDARWVEVDEHLLRFEVSANAFCHQMVRSIVGTLVDVGAGRLTPGDVRPIMLARDRHAAGTVAPPGGLVLWHVDYPSVGRPVGAP